MDRYKDYLDKLKNFSPEANFPKMQAKIKEKLVRKPFLTLPKLALATSLAVFLITFSLFYYSGPASWVLGQKNNESLVSWVLSHEDSNNDDIVLNYVLDS